MDTKQLQNLLSMLIISVIFFACNESATRTGAGSAVVEGRLEGSEQSNKVSKRAPVEGATVTAAKVTADGSLQIVDNDSEAETSASGEFSLNIDAETAGDATDKILIVAEHEGQQWKAVLAGELENGENIILKPIDDESTAEAAVFQQVVANGRMELVTKADIEAFIGSMAAGEIKNSTEAAAEFATALTAEAEARSRLFVEQSVEITKQQVAEVKSSKAEALEELHADLFASGSANARANAYDLFFETVANAHADAEINENAYGRVKEAAGKILIRNSTGLSSSVRAELRAISAYLVSIAIDNAVRARMEIANAAESSIQSAVQAGIQLRSEFKERAAVTQNELKAAFADYNDAVLEILKQEFPASAEIIVSINNEINRTAGIKAALETTVSASQNTDVIVQAYSTFYSGVSSIVNNLFPTANQTEARFISDIMILINLRN